MHVNLRAIYERSRSRVNEKVEPAQHSLLRAAFIHCLTINFISAPTNAILYATVEISTLHQVIRLWQFLGHTLEHVTQLKVFKVGNFNVYPDLLLLIFRNWLLLSFNFLFFNLLSSCCN